MNNLLKRFWFEFESNQDLPAGLVIGCGITAFNREDALLILKEKIFRDSDISPVITKEVSDIDITKLDKNHVLPNMLPPNSRGVWFPLGYN